MNAKDKILKAKNKLRRRCLSPDNFSNNTSLNFQDKILFPEIDQVR